MNSCQSSLKAIFDGPDLDGMPSLVIVTKPVDVFRAGDCLRYDAETELYLRSDGRGVMPWRVKRGIDDDEFLESCLSVA